MTDLAEDVEALAEEFCPGRHLISGGHQACVDSAQAVLASSWLAAHDERVRESERERLAGERPDGWSESAAGTLERLAGEVEAGRGGRPC